MIDCDVAIVGGGPAGLAAAIRLRERGFGCLVLERGGAPVDKACGEGLMPKGLRELESLGALALLDRSRSAPFEGIRYVQEDGSSVQARFAGGSGLGVRRLALAEALKARATALGADFLHCAVKELHQAGGFVELDTSEGPVRARLALGADGLHSIVRRAAGLDLPLPAGATRRFGLRRHYPLKSWTDFVEVHWQAGAEAYVTPTGPQSINVAFLWEGEAAGFDSLLARFPALQERLAGAEPSSESRGSGPLFRPVQAQAAGRLALVGDAAGYVDAITGQGLSLALSGAALFAAALPDELSDDVALGQGLSKYQTALRRRFRDYAWPAHALLWLAKRPRLRRRALRVVAGQPRLFAALLSLVA